MTLTIRRFVVALAVCALVPVLTVGAKDQVERPFKMSAQSQLVIDLNTGVSTADAEGVASHLGHFTAHAVGLAGTITAANGDTIDYVQVGENTVQIVGGTGRFTGAEGELEITVLTQEGPEIVDGTWVFTLTWTATGTIIY